MSIVYFNGWLMILYLNDKIFVPEIAISSSVLYGFLVWGSISFSKAQFNPAITIAQMLTKKMSQFNAMVVLISQLIGCYIGAILIYYTVPETLNNYAKEK
jgi:glycerol uptake facilitator-like aquaporin